MKNRTHIILALIALLLIITTGCASNDNNDNPDYTPQLVDLLFSDHLRGGYQMHNDIWGDDTITQEEYFEIKNFYLEHGDYSSELCILHTFDDGTEVLLILEPTYSTGYTIKRIQPLPQN